LISISIAIHLLRDIGFVLFVSFNFKTSILRDFSSPRFILSKLKDLTPFISRCHSIFHVTGISRVLNFRVLGSSNVSVSLLAFGSLY